MARKVIEEIHCDVCDAPDGVAESFGLHGAVYEIDLCASHAESLVQALAPFLDQAVKSRGSVRSPRRTTVPADRSAVRAWAKANGHAVSERGRIPAPVQDAFDAANSS